MKILVVVYYWPPIAGSGVQRWLKMTNYMQEMGHDIYVLTPSNPDFKLKDDSLLNDVHPDITIIKRPIFEPYKLARLISGKGASNTGTDSAQKNSGLLHKFINYVRARFFIPDPRKFWIRPSVKFLKNYLPTNDINLLITSGPPHSLHKIGFNLKGKLPDLKWIMDVRDPISHLDFLKDMGVEGSVKKRYEKYESDILGKADAVVGTSESLPEFLVDFNVGKYRVIPNGFDKKDFELYKSDRDETELSNIIISHAGVYNRYRFSGGMWKAFNLLHEEIDFEVLFAGPAGEEVIKRSRTFSGLRGDFTSLGYISHEEVMKIYKKSTVLLLLSNNSKMGKTTIPGKIFELMATGKPILGFGNPDGDAAYVLHKSGCGKMFSYSAAPEEIYTWLKATIESPTQARNEGYISRYEREALAKEYLNLCSELIQL